MIETEVKFGSNDNLVRALERAKELFEPLASKAITVSLVAIQEEIAPYPPQPDRMRSGRLNRYVRGQGIYPKSAFVPDAREPGGYRVKRTPKSKIKLTSQRMSTKFRTSVAEQSGGEGLIGALTNEATYSGYVIGWEMGDPHQAKYHAETGWVSADKALEAARPKIQQALEEAVDKFLTKLAKG